MADNYGIRIKITLIFITGNGCYSGGCRCVQLWKIRKVFTVRFSFLGSVFFKLVLQFISFLNIFDSLYKQFLLLEVISTCFFIFFVYTLRKWFNSFSLLFNSLIQTLFAMQLRFIKEEEKNKSNIFSYSKHWMASALHQDIILFNSQTVIIFNGYTYKMKSDRIINEKK